MENHWLQEIWHSSTPDCNPLDLSMWSVFEREVNKQPHNTLASLRAKILEVMAVLDREVVICPYKKLWSRIEAVICASVNFIKLFCIQYTSTLLLKFSVRYVHPNYLCYCFICVSRVCPNLSSAPCMCTSCIFRAYKKLTLMHRKCL
jgi:hypothetical protein